MRLGRSASRPLSGDCAKPITADFRIEFETARVELSVAAAPSSLQPTAPRGRRIWLIVGALLAVAVGGWLAVSRPWEAKPLQVATETVTAGPASRILASNGRIEPETSVNVSATVSGRIASVAVNDGDEVKAGALLATIDDAQQRAAVSQASSALDAARAQLQQAKINFERAQSLGDAISRKDLDTSQLALQTAQNDVTRLEAALSQAMSLLAQYSIKAPFDGTVLTRAVDPGQVVSSATVLFAFADLLHLRAEASIDELYSAEIHRGLKAKLQPSGYNRTLEGEVSFVAPTVDSSTGGRLVRVAIDDQEGLVLPIGLTVNLNIVVAEVANAITVPRAALITSGADPAVFVIEGGKAVLRPVEYIDWPSARLVVTSGLKEGEVLVAAPKGVTAGALVSPKAN